MVPTLTTAGVITRDQRGLTMYDVPMAGMARRANSRRAGRLGLALILMGLVTEGSSWILGASPGIGIPGICSFRSSHRVERKETTTTTTTPMMMMMHRSRKPGLGCLEGYCQGRGVELPYRILGAVDVSLRGALRPGEGGDADKGEISGEVGEDGGWDGRTSADSKEAASAMVEKIRNLVKDGSPRKCLACLDGLAHEEDLGEDEKALVVEAVLRGLVKLSRFDLVADAWKVIKDAGLPASDHIGTVVVKAMCRSQAGGVWTAMKVIGELEERKSGSWKDVYPVVCQARFSTRQPAEFAGSSSVSYHVPCYVMRATKTKTGMKFIDAAAEKLFGTHRHRCSPCFVCFITATC